MCKTDQRLRSASSFSTLEVDEQVTVVCRRRRPPPPQKNVAVMHHLCTDTASQPYSFSVQLN